MYVYVCIYIHMYYARDHIFTFCLTCNDIYIIYYEYNIHNYSDRIVLDFVCTPGLGHSTREPQSPGYRGISSRQLWPWPTTTRLDGFWFLEQSIVPEIYSGFQKYHAPLDGKYWCPLFNMKMITSSFRDQIVMVMMENRDRVSAMPILSCYLYIYINSIII